MYELEVDWVMNFWKNESNSNENRKSSTPFIWFFIIFIELQKCVNYTIFLFFIIPKGITIENWNITCFQPLFIETFPLVHFFVNIVLRKYMDRSVTSLFSFTKSKIISKLKFSTIDTEIKINSYQYFIK